MYWTLTMCARYFTLPPLSNLILPNVLCDGYCYFPHLPGDETEKLRNLPVHSAVEWRKFHGLVPRSMILNGTSLGQDALDITNANQKLLNNRTLILSSWESQELIGEWHASILQQVEEFLSWPFSIFPPDPLSALLCLHPTPKVWSPKLPWLGSTSLYFELGSANGRHWQDIGGGDEGSLPECLYFSLLDHGFGNNCVPFSMSTHPVWWFPSSDYNCCGILGITFIPSPVPSGFR